MNTLLIEKQTGGYFKFTLNGDTANAITSINNDLLAVGNQLHFKTGNGANIIKEQFIYPADVTIVSGGTFTFTTVAQVWDKLIAIDYFAWLGGGGTGGVDRFDDLLDTFSYTGNAGKAVIVDNSELKLVPITLYNKRLFTELEDTPSSLVPDKMVVVNPTGTALIFQDQPEPPTEYLNSVGYFDYNDLATQTTPLNAMANVALKLTNDTEGANTSTDQNPYGVSYVWDYTTNQFNFSELEVGDTIDVRVHVQITTTTSNQKVSLKAKFGIGSVSQFENSIFETTFKSSGLHEISFVAPFYMGSSYITDYPAELYLTTDASATVKVDGWYVRILRKNINIVTVDYQVEDATTTTKGIVRLAGDLAGTANNPTVPELANKVPTSRTVSTTSPLLGGGALSSNLTLSIQQANSIQSGYLSSTDWSHFESAYNDKINSATVTGTTTKTLTLNQQDGGTITASWTDINTDAVTSVFGRTGTVVAANGDYTTTQVTEGTNLYYTEARVDANTNVSANTSARHSAVTIGTANGLSLSGQELSLGLASTSATGALSSTDWNTFNGKQSALSGTGFVKISGTTISYDNNTYALDNAVVKLTGDQSIDGNKTFTTEVRTVFQNGDAAQITFKNTGDLTKTLNIGHGSNGNIFSSTGLDFRVGGLTSSALLIASNENATFKENLTAKSFIKSGGTSSQFLMADGSVSTGSGGTVTGTGTAGQVTFWSGTNTQTGDNGLSWNNTLKFLSVTGTNGTINYRENQIQFLRNSDNYITANGASAILYFEIGGAWRWRFNSAGNFISNGAQSISTSTGNLTISTLGGSGNILLTPNLTGNTQISSNTLIGTTTDAGYKLDVNGNQAFRGTTSSDTAPLGSELLTTGTGDASWTGTSFATGYTHVAGSVTTLTSTLAAVVSTFYQIAYTVTGRTAGSFTIDFGGVTRSGLTATGGVGTQATSTGTLVITPTTDFNGTIVLSIKTIGTSSATSSFFTSTGVLSNEIRVSNYNSNSFIGIGSGRRNTTGNANAFFGNQSGISNTTGSANAFFGINAGYTNTLGNNNSFFGIYSGQSNTTGSGNTAIGRSALFANTTGGNNTTIGQDSLSVNTTGSSNTSIGNSSMINSTTGNANVAIGLSSLQNLTGANNNNTAIGTNAGRYAGSGTTAMTSFSNSIYVGFQSRGLNATGSTNEIVIGYDVVGLGSNSTRIGNSSTTFTVIEGDLVLGSTTDNGTDKLQVTGSANITGQLKLGSTITNGTFTYTLPGATGTLALVGGAGVGTVTSVAAITLGTTGTDLSSTVANGTTTPVITLNVPTASATNRGALSSADWTTFNSKQNALTNPVTGTGTTNYIPKFTGSSAIGNSSIFDNGTNVGIGTASPAYKLQVNKSESGSNPSAVLRLENTGAYYTSKLTLTDGTTNDANISYLGANQSLGFGIGSSLNQMVLLSTGNVGIGTTSPVNPLTVQSNGSAQAIAILNRSSDDFSNLLFYNYAGSSVLGGIGNSSGRIRIMTGGVGDTYERLSITSGGNVLIGTTVDEGYKLQVSGKASINGYGLSGDFGANYNIGLGVGISGKGINMGYNATADMGFIGTVHNGTSWKNLSLCPIGGSVYIGISGNNNLFAGSATFSGTVTASGGFFNSDIRLKDLTDYDYNVSDIKPITYLWKDGRDNKKHVGYSAQEVQKVMPDAVNEDEKGFLSVNYIEVLVAKISQMEKEIAYLKSKI